MQQLRRFFPLALVAAFAVGCVFALHSDMTRLSFAPLLRSWDVVLLAALLSLLNYALRAMRWQRYLAVLGYSLPLGFTTLTYVAGFAFTLSPGKVGELARARYYSRLGISSLDVAGAFCAERLMDLMAMLVLATLILTAVPRYNIALGGAAAMAVAALALLALLPWGSIASSVAASPRIPPALVRLCVGAGKALAAASSLLRPGALVLGFLVGLMAWGLEGLGLYLLADVFPPAHVAPAIGVGIYAVAVLVGAMSFLPGGLGGTEAIMTALLCAQGYPVGDALLITLVCRLVTLWLAVCLGWAAVLTLRHRLIPAAVPWQ